MYSKIRKLRRCTVGLANMGPDVQPQWVKFKILCYTALLLFHCNGERTQCVQTMLPRPALYRCSVAPSNVGPGMQWN
jgi:hypothetical protein